MDTTFKIDNETLQANIDLDANSISIKSSPRPYEVLFKDDIFSYIKEEVKNNEFSYIFFIDDNIAELYKEKIKFMKDHTYKSFHAVEEFKNVDAAFDLCDTLLECNANRKTILYVIGGGIMQDIGAYAAATFKRGIPWVYVPTTLLGQSDSCVGGKTGLNYKHTKNLIALFSAPRQVLIDPMFISTLRPNDIYSGHGEILRLVLTGGPAVFKIYKELIGKLKSKDEDFLNPNLNTIKKLIKLSLLVKKSVVEKDEFEINLRKSMNYGHSIGHAIEILSNHEIPHGQAVAIGILIENLIAKEYLSLSENIIKEIHDIAKDIISEDSFSSLESISKESIIDVMRRDKKVEGKYLKLATICEYGDMKFIDFPLNDKSEKLVNSFIGQITK
jgi:3-dehydroquinate synthase